MAREASRDQTKERFWRRLVGGQARSGLSVRAWCHEHDLNEPTFYWWRRRLALDSRQDRHAISERRGRVACHGLARTERKRESRFRKPTFVSVLVSQPEVDNAASFIEIVLPGDRRIRVSGAVDRRALADVLAVMMDVPHRSAATDCRVSGAETSPC